MHVKPENWFLPHWQNYTWYGSICPLPNPPSQQCLIFPPLLPPPLLVTSTFHSKSLTSLHPWDISYDSMLQSGTSNTGTFQEQLSWEHPKDSLPCHLLQNIGAVQAYAFAQVFIQCESIYKGDLWPVLCESLISTFNIHQHQLTCFTHSCHTALANAFKVYIINLQYINKLVSQELGCNAPDWWVKHACPPCTYEECAGI